MKSILTIPDLLMFSSIIILSLTIIVLLFRIKVQNYFPVFLLSFHFIVTNILVLVILLLKFQFITHISVFKITLIAVLLCLYNILHFLYIKSVVKKETKFNKRDLFHLTPVAFILISVVLFFKPLDLFSNRLLTEEIELLNSIYSSNISLYYIILRIIHPTVYIILGSSLVIGLFRSSLPISKPHKQIQTFILLFLSNKIATLVWFSLGLIAIKTGAYFLVDISKIGFSISSLTIASYILLNPTLLLNISKTNSPTKKTIIEDNRIIDFYFDLNKLITTNQLYLDANYTLTNLSNDSGISAITIRDVISQNGFENYSRYINSFRISHAETLIQNGYLENFSIESLSKNSGFQSEVTFYRVFKKNNKCTPNQYRQNLIFFNNVQMGNQ